MGHRPTSEPTSRRVRSLAKRKRHAVRDSEGPASLAQDLDRGNREHRERMLEQIYRVIVEFADDFGISRQATRRLFLKAERSVGRSPYRLHQAVHFQTMLRISEILGAWYREPVFLDEHGKPRSLPLEGAKSFESLVTRFLPRFKLDDIVEILVAERVLRRDARGELIPMRRTVIFTKPGAMMLDRVPVIVQGLLSTIRHNANTKDQRGTRCERLTILDRLPVEAIPAFNEQVKKLAQSLLNQADNWALQRQLAPGSRSRKKTARAGVEVFAYVADETRGKRGAPS
jgi:Family of unknown function (DUF6502)